MLTSDVIIAGGGPAGSACAWKLRQSGLDVVVLDRAVFPRDKVCAGWITPQVVTGLQLDLDDYRQGRTLQPITGFLTGTIGGDREVEVAYDHPVSYGIRRREFDHYLLERSGARLELGTPITSIRRADGQWIVNDRMAAPMLVGAGGHFCAVARWLNGVADTSKRAPLVVAQEDEFAIDPRDAGSFSTTPERPELYFCRDLGGYGWCFRKQGYINVGFGRIGSRSLPRATAEFVAFMEKRQKVPPRRAWHWRGHAYLLQDANRRQVVDAGLILVGDAAGLAYPQSGEGIRPAIESGLLGALTIVEADGQYTLDQLKAYEARLHARFASAPYAEILSRIVPSKVWAPVASVLLGIPGFVRHVALDRWFLHADQPALA